MMEPWLQYLITHVLVAAAGWWCGRRWGRGGNERELHRQLREIYNWTAYKQTPWAIRTKKALEKGDRP